MKGRLDLTSRLGLAALGLMDTSPLVALGSVAPPARTAPPVVQPPPKRHRPNANATRQVFGSKYPGVLLREITKTKGVGRPPRKAPDGDKTE